MVTPWLAKTQRPKLGRTATAMHPRPWLSAPSRGQQSEIHGDPSKDVGTGSGNVDSGASWDDDGGCDSGIARIGERTIVSRVS
ncbi:hypothetical protein CKAH01_08474 [Colletotrichum kahawae]|uniref:Uncharacterized protein n=1 Tax=Colletotrichum kahawae TaxID=34407 RepID=A0AAE0CZJ3_COLKA|nr:hypothetical protein CKAH01_08474 [Colletotrichum kahawae]